MSGHLPPELERAKTAMYAVVDAATAVCAAATGHAPHRPPAQAGPPVDPARLAVTADYATALDHLDRCVHGAPAEYVAEAARRFLAAVTDATAAPALHTALTTLRAALDDLDAAHAVIPSTPPTRQAGAPAGGSTGGATGPAR
ncbi:hypothetical protein [Actinomadura formosensis]|uniref:hypothetical protein n=1 Tax=Actinomadura formosensis TaxID=60706 RepID=UPI00082CF581|nr:hypothetical protein [Actinomadura formosensis]